VINEPLGYTHIDSPGGRYDLYIKKN